MVGGLLGITGGTLLSESRLFALDEKTVVNTPYGPAEVYKTGKAVFVQRHRSSRNIPPHSINHKANLWAMKSLGVSEAIGVGSTGSLRKTLKPPAILVPDDFLQLSDIPTFFDYKIVHLTPELDEGLRKRIIAAAKKANTNPIAKGVYAQTRGPRLETKAEVRLLSAFANVVGMTLASEATLAREIGLPYAMLCSVDNFANGLSKEPLDFRKVKGQSVKNSGKIERILKKII